MNTLTALWLMDITLASLVMYATIRYLNLVAPASRRMAYKVANPFLAIMARLGRWYAPAALLLVGMLANALVLTGNVLASLTAIICGLIALRKTQTAYYRLVR